MFAKKMPGEHPTWKIAGFGSPMKRLEMAWAPEKKTRFWIPQKYLEIVQLPVKDSLFWSTITQLEAPRHPHRLTAVTRSAAL